MDKKRKKKKKKNGEKDKSWEGVKSSSFTDGEKRPQLPSLPSRLPNWDLLVLILMSSNRRVLPTGVSS